MNELENHEQEAVNWRAPGSESFAKLDNKNQSTRIYEPSPVIVKEISMSKVIFEKSITADTRVCLIGDGQGMDTAQFLEMGVTPENISAINYEQSEVDQANRGILHETGVMMKQGDATNFDSFKGAGIEEGSQDVVTLMHVLEVPGIKGEVERGLIENVSRILKSDGELLVSQYKHKFTKSERDLQKRIGIEEITAESMQKQLGDSWRDRFRGEYGLDWEEGMRYGEISNVRTREELVRLFEPYFEIELQETEGEYILRMKKK